jgi:thioredoxin-related protein
MKKYVLLVVLCVVAGYSASFAAEGIQWMSLKEGMIKAKIEQRPLIVDFYYGKGCPRCESLQKNVYDEPSIARKIMSSFVPVKIDLTKPLTAQEDALGKKFEYKNDCLLLFLDHNGELIHDTEGKRLCFVDKLDPKWFDSYLDLIIKKYEVK